MWNGTAQHGKNFSTDVTGTDPMDLNGHGTHVAGTIGAVGNNGIGVTGVCWKATVMAVRVLGADGSGTSAGIIQGIDYAVQNGAKVLNMSLGGGGTPDPAYSAAITRAQTADVVVVVAAGNDGKDNETTAVYPCNFPQPNLICVAALDQAFGLASFSNWGATSVDVGAPGTNIVNTWPGPVFEDPLTAGWSGTTTTAGGGWGFASIGLTNGSTLKMIAVPSPFNAGSSYNSNTDARAYSTYVMSGAAKAVLKFSAIVEVAANDIFRVGWKTGLTDPFSGGTVVSLTPATGFSNWPSFDPVTVDISTCGGGNCAIGVQLQSDGVGQSARGIGIADFTIHGIFNSSTSYNTENGTSMATPAVAGLATMLRAFHGPAFTAADVIGAIKGGGRLTASLTGKTTSGRAADAMGALAFINPPSGLTAVVH
jgi:subtilisin family serine protease